MTTKHIEGAETIRALKAQVEALTADNLGWFHHSEKLTAKRDAALKLAADRLVNAERYKKSVAVLAAHLKEAVDYLSDTDSDSDFVFQCKVSIADARAAS